MQVRLAVVGGNFHNQYMRYLSLAALIVCAACSGAHANNGSFDQWLVTFKQDAIQAGVPGKLVDETLGGAKPISKVIELDRKQPGDKITFTRYKNNILSKARVAKGRKLYKKHRAELEKVAAKTGVAPQYIIALWGIETNFGGYTGNFDTLKSLATLAYEGRRADFFRKELIAGLKILAEGKISKETLKGSWAGAMGQCQFMPSSYHSFAVDGDGDGVKDIWNSLPDVFASIANYLKIQGWDGEFRWGREVRLPKGMTLDRETLYNAKTLAEFRKQGITMANGQPLADIDVKGYVMHPGEPNEGSYIVYQNYHVLLDWNRSRYFATAVGLLADAIAAGGN